MEEVLSAMETTEQDVLEIKHILTYWAESRPNAQIQDYIKQLYQSEFGGSHMLKTPEKAMEWLTTEINGLTEKQKRREYIYPCLGSFCRMNLSVSKELSPELIHRIFMVSAANIPKTAWFRFEEKLRIFREVCREQPGLFRFTPEEVDAYLEKYREDGYPVVSHSDAYRKVYEPAYRVIRKEYAKSLPLYAAMEKCLREKGTVNVAIDGPCGSGKSSAAQLIATLWDCNVFHADDYFLPLPMRTPERMAEVGGNMDRERFKKEICEQVKAGKPFAYTPFDCAVMQMGRPVEVQPKAVNIFEGSYSMHPELREYYDVTAFLTISPIEQEARILARNGSMMLRRYLEEWIPKENEYFEAMKVQEACGFVID